MKPIVGAVLLGIAFGMQIAVTERSRKADSVETHAPARSPEPTDSAEVERIRQHLERVERELRARDVSDMPAKRRVAV